ncbi:MAG: 7-carboxy-7-deazaguanine synthase [Alphaproteobacteria bacterium]|nr:MAG: 7-carboxy-7-deazaguanine synthase [Alphaproteobacteria bacterium]
MTYSVKELFYTLQGEGVNAGRAAIFCRFSGCNLWSGREEDRTEAVCSFCDTDFVGVDGDGGGKFATVTELVEAAKAQLPAGVKPSLLVMTGGEPLLQVDHPLIDGFHAAGFEVAVETNGTIAAIEGLDWICVSPKAHAPLKQISGHELKLVYPQVEPEAQPERFEHLAFTHFMLQPMDGPDIEANTKKVIQYCQDHPQWRMSLQTHKFLGIR